MYHTHTKGSIVGNVKCMNITIIKQVLIDSYWLWRKALFYVFTKDDKTVSLDWIWYNIRDSRNGKLIETSIREARSKGLKEVEIKLYKCGMIKLHWN